MKKIELTPLDVLKKEILSTSGLSLKVPQKLPKPHNLIRSARQNFDKTNSYRGHDVVLKYYETIAIIFDEEVPIQSLYLNLKVEQA